ncbi:helix-turn-helix domain-containing protein [Mesorhizobium amorphae]
MKIRDWRQQQNLSFREAAEFFGIGGGKNPARRMQRIETGESPVDAVLADKIVNQTGRVVTLQDINDTRRDFLANQQEAVS